MPVTIELDDDVALVIFELLASEAIEHHVAPPERNALWSLEGKLEKVVNPFSDQYADLLAQSRASLLVKYGS